MIEIPTPQRLRGLSPYYVIYSGKRLFGAYVWVPTVADARKTATKLQNQECLRTFDFPAPVLDICSADLKNRSTKVAEELLEALRRDIDCCLKNEPQPG